MSIFNKNPIQVTLDYGQGIDQVEKGEEGEKTKNYDYTKELRMKVLDYRITKIKYSLNENQGIQSLEMIYKNRNDGSLKTLLDTVDTHLEKETINEINFGDDEEIIDTLFYIKNTGELAAICIYTNTGTVKYLGDQSKGTVINDNNFSDKNKRILGYGVHACKKLGVTSIYSYFIDKIKYGIIKYSGLLYLRAKLRKNPDFQKETENKISTLTELQKLILKTCYLPDTAFFPLISYLLTE